MSAPNLHRSVLLSFMSCVLLFLAGTSTGRGQAHFILNPIVIENQQAGTTAWQPPDLDRMVERRIAENRVARASEAAPISLGDRGGMNAAPAQQWLDTRLIEGYASAESVNAG